LFQIGGVESQARWRYVFRAELSIDGILMPDEEPFVLMNVPHPILSVGRLAKQGMRFIFDAQGFSF
jgi:hypothetical protein